MLRFDVVPLRDYLGFQHNRAVRTPEIKESGPYFSFKKCRHRLSESIDLVRVPKFGLDPQPEDHDGDTTTRHDDETMLAQ